MKNPNIFGYGGGALAGGLSDYDDEDHAIRYVAAKSNLYMRKSPSTKSKSNIIKKIPRGSKVALSTFADDETFTEGDLDLIENQGIEYSGQSVPFTNEGIKWGFISYPADEDQFGWVAQKYLSASKPSPLPADKGEAGFVFPPTDPKDKADKAQQAGMGTGSLAVIALVGVAAYLFFAKKK